MIKRFYSNTLLNNTKKVKFKMVIAVKHLENYHKNNYKDFQTNYEGWNVGDSMNENDYKRILEKMKTFAASIPSSSPKESTNFLIKTGIYDQNGQINKVYQK
jgi:hypothetical protein